MENTWNDLLIRLNICFRIQLDLSIISEGAYLCIHSYNVVA